jgi:hypothetical protein
MAVSRRFFDHDVDLTNKVARKKWMMDLSMMLDDILGGLASNAEWTPTAFNAGNFTANGSMTWTVDAGDVNTYEYLIIGKTMWIIFDIQTSSIGGSLSNSLRLTIPESKVAAKNAYGHVNFILSGVFSNGFCRANAGTTYIDIIKGDASNFPSQTNAARVSGQIFFEIQ